MARKNSSFKELPVIFVFLLWWRLDALYYKGPFFRSSPTLPQRLSFIHLKRRTFFIISKRIVRGHKYEPLFLFYQIFEMGKNLVHLRARLWRVLKVSNRQTGPPKSRKIILFVINEGSQLKNS